MSPDTNEFKYELIKIEQEKQHKKLGEVAQEARDNRESIATLKVSHEGLQAAVDRLSVLLYGVAGTVISGLLLFYFTWHK